MLPLNADLMHPIGICFLKRLKPDEMKKITEFGGNLVAGCSLKSMNMLAIVTVIFLMCLANITGAAAQALRQKGNDMAIAVTGTNALANFAFTTRDGGADRAGEPERIAKKVEGHLWLYPNPVSDYLLVMLPVATVTDKLVTVSSMDGETLATDTIAAGATNTVIDMKKIPLGAYVVTIDDVADRQVLRLVKN